MAKYMVPVYISIEAESAQVAAQQTLSFMEYAIDTSNDDQAITDCFVGYLDEVIELGDMSGLPCT